MTQLGVWNVPNEDPLDAEDTLPLIRSPDGAASRVIDRCQHLSHAAEVTAVDSISDKHLREDGKRVTWH